LLEVHEFVEDSQEGGCVDYLWIAEDYLIEHAQQVVFRFDIFLLGYVEEVDLFQLQLDGRFDDAAGLFVARLPLHVLIYINIKNHWVKLRPIH
jgi:hypothetical protein